MTRGKIIRWTLTALMLFALALLVSSPALAEITPLALEQTVFGQPPLEDGWVTIPASKALADESVLAFGTAQPKVLKYSSKTREWTVTDKAATVSKFAWQRYEDPSISIRTEFLTIVPAAKPKSIPASVTYIRIADPSQLRTAMSNDSYKARGYISAEKMAKHVNAVVAVNGDFFKYHADIGYVLRQGELYRDKLNGKRDLLLIDEQGDFHAVYAATSEATKAFMDALEDGRRIINTVTLGPVLVENGAARDMKETSTAKAGEFQWKYAQQRVAILQTGPLEYAIVEAYGKTDGSMGMSLQEMADLIAYLFPDCVMAYNLDGGGSTNVVVNGKRIHVTPGHRDISDIIYFASAYTE